MISALRLIVLLAVLVTLVEVVTPPVIENHHEIGFCSADCPVQHAASGAAIAPPAPPRAAQRLAVIVTAVPRGIESESSTADAPDAPRAPPSA